MLIGLIDSYKAIGNHTKVAFYNEYKNEILRRIWGEDILDKIKD